MLLAVAFLSLLPALDRYAGTYSLAPQESDEIRPAIERVISRMNFMIRGIARGRLLKTQIPFSSITMVSSDSEFRIRHAGGTDVHHTNIETPVHTKGPDGAQIVVRLVPGPPVMQSYEAQDGKRENTYTLSPDGGTLTLNVRVSSPRLPEDIRYRLVYKRASSAP